MEICWFNLRIFENFPASKLRVHPILDSLISFKHLRQALFCRADAPPIPYYQCVMCSCQLQTKELLLLHLQRDHSLLSSSNEIRKTAPTILKKLLLYTPPTNAKEPLRPDQKRVVMTNERGNQMSSKEPSENVTVVEGNEIKKAVSKNPQEPDIRTGNVVVVEVNNLEELPLANPKESAETGRENVTRINGIEEISCANLKKSSNTRRRKVVRINRIKGIMSSTDPKEPLDARRRKLLKLRKIKEKPSANRKEPSDFRRRKALKLMQIGETPSANRKEPLDFRRKKAPKSTKTEDRFLANFRNPWNCKVNKVAVIELNEVEETRTNPEEPSDTRPRDTASVVEIGDTSSANLEEPLNQSKMVVVVEVSGIGDTHAVNAEEPSDSRPGSETAVVEVSGIGDTHAANAEEPSDSRRGSETAGPEETLPPNPMEPLDTRLNVVEGKSQRDTEKTDSWRCLACDCRFSDNSDFWAHVRVAHGGCKNFLLEELENGYCCEVCGCGFTNWDYLFAHRETVHPEVANAEFDWNKCLDVVLLCGACLQYFRKGIWFENHKCAKLDLKTTLKMSVALMKQPEFKCQVCLLRFKWKPSYERHLLTEHGNAAVVENPAFPKDMDYYCISCAKSFDSETSLQEHVCEILDETVRSPAENSARIERQRGENIISLQASTSDGSQKKVRDVAEVSEQVIRALYRCVSCTKNFYSQKSLQEHLCQTPGETVPTPTTISSNQQRSDIMALTSNIPQKIIREVPLLPAGQSIRTKYRCVTCTKNFCSETSLREHICQIPDDAVPAPDDISTDLQRQSGENISLPVSASNNLRNVVPKVPEVDKQIIRRRYPCETCTKSFDSETSLLEHICQIPDETEPTSGNIPADLRHRSDENTSLLESASGSAQACTGKTIRKTDPEQGTFPCPFCDLVFKGTKPILQHASEVHGRNLLSPFYCVSCDKYFKLRGRLRTHNATYHSLRLNAEQLREVCDRAKVQRAEGLRYACPTCPQLFPNADKYLLHYAWHTAERNFKCELCGEAKTTEDEVRCHVQNVHTRKVRRFICDQCGCVYGSGQALKRHMVCHGGKPAAKCDICGRTFLTHDKLKQHRQEVHSETAATSPVAVCMKEVRSKMQPEQHAGTDTAEKKFGCSDCGKAFTRKLTLTRHKEKLHNGAPCQCSVCAAQFFNSLHLQRHMSGHVKKKRGTVRKRSKDKGSAEDSKDNDRARDSLLNGFGFWNDFWENVE